jgi:cytochrome c-type biogenesis protein
METLFTVLTDAMNGSVALALVASFAWGVLSILLSPCHLSSIPLVIGFLTEQGERKGSRGLLLSFVFAVGTLVTVAVIGAITAAAGRIMGDVGPYGTYAVAGVLVVVGLYLMDLIRLPDTGVVLRPLHIRSPHLSALVLGLIFGIALGPCTFAFLAPILGVVFNVSATNPTAAGALLLSYSAGYAGIIAAAGGVTTRVQAYLDWTNRSHVILWIKRVAGFLVVLGGAYIIYSS